jgi:ribosomal protein S18 acetylase RimI-like enzyme
MSQMELTMRKAKEQDAEQILELVIRLKKLNEEFDPLFSVSEDARKAGEQYVKNAINSQESFVAVAEAGKRVVGMVKVDFRTRVFYTPKREGRIVDLYLLPEFRRKGFGEKMVNYVWDSLKGKIDILTVEFPSANKISTSFYTKLGFRPIVNIYAKRD